MAKHLPDITIVGGGIVGVTTAYCLTQRYPDCRVVIVEKENELAAHQTGHNSGVIHSGLYYKPGSKKAKNCVAGGALLKEFCRRHDIAVDECGKVVVATNESELGRLDELHRRGVANGVPGVAMIDAERLHEIEPHVAGIRALHVPEAGSIDYRLVVERVASRLATADCEIRKSTRVRSIKTDGDALIIETNGEAIRTRYMIGCAGLHSDRVTRMEGGELDTRIVPFRGEYYDLIPDRQHLVRGLIYPVPDPRFPFLGVHFTRRVDGSVEAGPNAVLALAREGYRKAQFRLEDVLDIFTFPGFWRMAAKYWQTGVEEMTRSWSKTAFVKALRHLIPEITAADLTPGGSGVRAQALQPSGDLVDDFVIVERPRGLHVCNAPSPAATSSLSIASEIVDRAERLFDLGTAVEFEHPTDWL